MASLTSTKQEAIVRQLSRQSGLRLIEYKGDAMMGAHIVPHSKLLIDNTREPQNGDVVVVQRGSKFLVRFYKCNDHKQWLVSANKNYADMLFSHTSDIDIYVVIKVITDTSLLSQYMV
ncbi:MAG: S24 family peptidase [Chitinophagaceae bacterium]|nr:S24 family peptidase [Chitinophagaceae bacterium]